MAPPSPECAEADALTHPKSAPVLALTLALALHAGVFSGIATASAEPVDTVHAFVLDALHASFNGAPPDTLTVETGGGAREVGLDDALALLAASGAPGPAALDGTLPPEGDVGYGVRTGPEPCYAAVLVTVVRTTAGPALNVRDDGPRVPAGRVPCGAGADTWVGSVTATVAQGVDAAVACVAYEGPLGAWAQTPERCHVNDFSEATLQGRVGHTRASACSADGCLVIEHLLGGVVDPLGAGGAEGATIRIR